MKACFEYECSRERAKLRRQAILKEAKEIEQRCEDDEDEKFRELLDLQEELNQLRQESKLPWLSLPPCKRTTLSSYEERSDRSEPVILFADLPSLGQALTRRNRLDLVIDWSKSEKRLKNSFGKLIRRLRLTPGTNANLTSVVDERGQKLSAKQKLLRLVLYRCRKGRIRFDRILLILDSFRRHGFAVPAESTLQKKFALLAREGERLIVPFGWH